MTHCSHHLCCEHVVQLQHKLQVKEQQLALQAMPETSLQETAREKEETEALRHQLALLKEQRFAHVCLRVCVRACVRVCVCAGTSSLHTEPQCAPSGWFSRICDDYYFSVACSQFLGRRLMSSCCT